jgi:hypothetical protein
MKAGVVTELGIGEVVRIAVVGDGAAEVDHFAAALSEGAELSGLLTAMPQAGEAQHRDFGTWEVVQEFVILATSGTTSAAITAAIHALWKRGHAEKHLPLSPSPSEQAQPGTTPQPQQITVGLPADGVTEITIRLHRD